MNCEKNIFENVDALSDAFAQMLRQKLAKTDTLLSIALSGGSTPAKIFQYLTRNHQTDIDWAKIIFFWGDERCVDPADEQSNYKMTRVNLLEPLGIPQSNIFRIKGENNPETAASDYAAVLKSKLPESNGLPVFDMVLLGLGEDGHTASIFPGDENNLYSDSSTGVATNPETRQKRITLTMPVINNASSVFFLVTGASKAPMVQTIISGKGYPQYPAAFVKPTKGTCEWMLDEAAARLLTSQ